MSVGVYTCVNVRFIMIVCHLHFSLIHVGDGT